MSPTSASLRHSTTDGSSRIEMIPSGVESFLSSEQIADIQLRIDQLNDNQNTLLAKQLNDLESEAEAIGYSLYELSEAFLDTINDTKFDHFPSPVTEHNKQPEKETSMDTETILSFLSSNQVNKLISLIETLSEQQEHELTVLLDQIDLSDKDQLNTIDINNNIIQIFSDISGEDLSEYRLS